MPTVQNPNGSSSASSSTGRRKPRSPDSEIIQDQPYKSRSNLYSALLLGAIFVIIAVVVAIAVTQ